MVSDWQVGVLYKTTPDVLDNNIKVYRVPILLRRVSGCVLSYEKDTNAVNIVYTSKLDRLEWQVQAGTSHFLNR